MKVDTSASFLRFVYPFHFEAERFEQYVEAVDAAAVRAGLRCWEGERFAEDDLLAHVRQYLNPAEEMPATARLWRLNPNAVKPWLCGFADAGTRVSRVELLFHDGKRWQPFRFTGIQMVLFRSGVGLLTIEAQPEGEELADWLDFLYAFRFAYGQREVKVSLRFHLLGGQVEEHPLPHLGRLIDDLLCRSALGDEVRDRQRREVFVPGQLIAYSCLYVDSDGSPLDDVTRAELLYRVRHCFPHHRPVCLSQQDCHLDCQQALMPYAEGMWFTFSLEGGAFVAIDAERTKFFRQELPAHIGKHYFLLFSLALYQRFTLLVLSRAVSEKWFASNERERVRAFERIRDQLLGFTARGYFAQVMQRDNHHRVYQRWQEVFQVERLYQEVRDEVQEMYGHIQSERANRLERRVNLLGALIGIPALVISFLNINLQGITVRGEGMSLPAALAVSAASFALGGLVWWLLNRRL